jgi:alkylation response protein AidB-like acyl-CoA dehydrogenase
MTYRAPVDDIMHALKAAAGLDKLIERGLLGDVDEATIRAVIEEAGKFGAEVLEPLSAPGDRAGSKLVDGRVVTPPGWKEAYRQFADGGWGALPAPEEWGGRTCRGSWRRPPARSGTRPTWRSGCARC